MKKLYSLIKFSSLIFLIVFSNNLLSDNDVLKKDLFLGNWSPWKSTWEISLPVCVAGSSDDVFFSVTASGQHAGSGYSVSNDLSHTVDYQVYWQSSGDQTQTEMLRSGIQSTRIYRYSKSKNCDDGNRSQLRVELNKTQIDQAIAGIYNDTLLLVLSPI